MPLTGSARLAPSRSTPPSSSCTSNATTLSPTILGKVFTPVSFKGQQFLVGDRRLRILGQRHHFLGLKSEAAVQVIEVGPDHRQEAPATRLGAVDEDADRFILFICLHQSLAPFEFQDDPGPPAGLAGAEHVGADDEPGQEPFRQNGILIAEVQAGGRLEICRDATGSCLSRRSGSR